MNNFDSVLVELRVSPSLLGFTYLRSALELATEDATIMTSVTRRLYPEIAERYHSTASRVERSVRHAIEASWHEMDVETKKKYFVVNRADKPTNSDYIATLLLHFEEGKS